MRTIEIYIDGSSSGNPGPSGWAAVCKENGQIKVKTGYTSKDFTNNQSELSAAILAIGAVKHPHHIVLYTDSQYLCTCHPQGEERLTKPDRKNNPLWFQFFKALKDGGHTCEFVKIDGHNGIKMNELADKYAKAGSKEGRHERYGYK